MGSMRKNGLAAVRRTALFCEPPLNGVHVSEVLTPSIGDHVYPMYVWQVASRPIFQHKYLKDKDLPARQPEEKKWRGARGSVA